MGALSLSRREWTTHPERPVARLDLDPAPGLRPAQRTGSAQLQARSAAWWGVTDDDTDGSDPGVFHYRVVVASAAAPCSDAVACTDNDRCGLGGLDIAAAGGLV